MDGGDTDALLTEINGATSLNAGQVVQNLLNRSPWLSTQALTATTNKKQVLTENSVVQILSANPQCQSGCLIPGCHLTNANGEKEVTTPSLVIYPNPVGDLLNFQLQGVPFTKDTVFRIVNMDGKVVKEINGVNVQATVTVSVAGWPSGAYLMQCLAGGAVLCSEKFIKQ